MRDTKRAVRPASSGDSEPIAKPAPPTDLWAQLDAALATVSWHQERPANAFTVQEYIARAGGRSENWGRRRLNALIKLGKLEHVGKYFRLLKESSDD
jgi:hypothetical protein